MTSQTRAALAALLIAAAPLALALPAAAQSRDTSNGDDSRIVRPNRNTAAAAAPKGPVVGRDVGRELGEASTAITANKLPDALESIKKAQVAATTPYEKVKVNQFLMMVSHNMQDDATAATAAEAAADAAIPIAADLTPDDKAQIFTNGTIFAMNAKHNDKAVVYAQQMIALNLSDARSQQIISQALNGSGDNTAMSNYAKQRIAAATAAGQRPPRDAFELLLNAQIKAKDQAGAEQTMEQLIATYNDPNDWQALIDVAISQPNVRDLDIIYLGRLLFATGVKVSKQNADIVGQTASHLAFYGDAQNAAAKGGTGFSPDPAKIAADKASIQQQITAGATQNGQYNIKLAQALYSYAMFAEAETAAKLAQTKGGAADPSEVGLVLGMSQVANGKFSDAVTTFGGVTGGGPATPRVVRLWTTFAKNKMTPPGPVAAAPAAPAQ